MADPRVVIVTGMSGAGRSQTANVLEDVGYFVVDNLPSNLITQVVDGAGLHEGRREQMALVVDTRGQLTAEDLEAALLGLHSRGVRTTVLFLDADDATLVRRFEETRRTHPVLTGRLAEKIATERRSFEEIRGTADIIIDTTDLDVHQLRRRIEQAFSNEFPERQMRIDIQSFGFKRGVPRVVDLMFDVRFLPNPHWVPELRPLTGRDDAVRDYVLEQPDSKEFLDQVGTMLHFLIPRYAAEGKSYLTIGIGCTGGRHRSVALADEIGRMITDLGDIEVSISHRDLADAGS
jgi:UPF0042 nucleotide-binding protein